MTILQPDSPPPPHAFRSSLRRMNRSLEIEICAESLRTVNLSRAEEDNSLPPERGASLRSSSYNDGIDFCGYGDGKGFYAEKLQFCSSHRLKANTDKDDDDDDDGMEWANAIRPLQTALRSFGYGDSKGFFAAKMASGKENNVKFPCKLASSIAWQQHAGPIKPNSGPFSGPLRVTARPNSVVKANMAPSIIPVNLFCKKMLGFDLSEPMSPVVTCLGRVKIKEITHNKDVHATTEGKLAQKVEKGRCFDTKNQLCGKKAKGRKKKTVAEKSRCLSRRRFMSKEAADSKSLPSLGLAETRREKAARSLAGLLEEVCRLEKDTAHYVPSVPPPNSLLLMRGGRMRDEIHSPMRQNVDEATIDNRSLRGPLRVEALDEGGPCEANVKNLRNSAPIHVTLLDLIDMEDEDFSASEMEDTMTTWRTHAIVQGTSLSERENFGLAVENDDKKSDKGSSLMPPLRASLWQRRAIAELTAIEVKQCTKKKTKQLIIR